jgi:hypothetical protein
MPDLGRIALVDCAMPRANQFRHQAYTPSAPAAPHCLVTPGAHPPVGSEEFQRRMDRVGSALDAAGVAAVYLAHGTFVGPDALGVLAGLARVFPKAGAATRRVIKQIVDKITGEVGNYTGQFAQCFEASIRRPDRPHIAVRRFAWSSENHHLGRADGAVRLIDELAAREIPPGKRILLWGHSHAGNVFALMTNLLAGDRRAVDEFFKAAAVYYAWPVVGCVDIPVWDRVRERLQDADFPLRRVPLDMVTFGTPIRYGWDSDGYARLLHFVNHRPAQGLPEYRAPFPPKLDDVLTAADGDYVQQLGIAGTNVMPSVFSWRSWLADKRLNDLLQHDLGGQKPAERFQAGAIVHDEGTTLLVDYGPLAGGIAQHLAGHAVYTAREWLLFHAEETVRRFYA